jgi:mannose-6-phosphate isomerase-like protein (cupin superfamily)
MDAFELDELEPPPGEPVAWHEFIRVPDLSAGVYRLAAGASDPQSPHTEDELYHVVRGRARIRVADEDRPVGPGSIVFVPAGTVHRFHAVEEALTVLVVFGPAERTLRSA